MKMNAFLINNKTDKYYYYSGKDTGIIDLTMKKKKKDDKTKYCKYRKW